MMVDPITQRFLDNAGQNGPLLLMYHSIQAAGRVADWQWGTTLDEFCAHLDLLQQNNWTTILVNQLASTGTWPPRTVAITFDDGYADNLLAVDALQQRGMRATFFVVTGSLGSQSGWRDPDVSPQPMLSREELRTMAEAGMEIGSHSRSHARLPDLSARETKDEVAGSRIDLEEIMGTPVKSFAYPYGQYTPKTIDAVREAGYQVACSTRPGFHRDGNPYELRRISVFNTDNVARLARKLAFADNHGSWATVGRYYMGRIRSRLGQAEKH